MSRKLKKRIAIDRRRYRRVRGFFFRAFVRVFFFDVLLRLPLLRILRSKPVPRWVAIASRYRVLAVDMGGVLIKLGQYLSTRVDLLPGEVIRELSGLQDEVPAAALEPIVEQIEDDFGRPLEEIFPVLIEKPLGAASLAQAHEAQLPDGRPVVVKVLRPGIDVLVETDLLAIGGAIRWLKWWRFVRRRVDLDWVEEEFTATTRRELDLVAEGRHAERFAECFANDPGLLFPRIYWEYTARRTLTEENVAYTKIADRAALEAAGVDRREVARKLWRTFMEQIFVHSFVHADPHPGNLFVKPLAEGSLGGPAFQIAFVDFGMVAEIPERLRSALRQFLIGLGRRDSAQVIQAFRDAGSLLPGADLAQLEEALDAIFERFWGVDVSRMNTLAFAEAAPLWREFGRLLLETPVQVQVDLMFTGRAMEILGGLVTSLDPEFNPWREAAPFAERLAAEARGPWQVQAAMLVEQGRLLTQLPGELVRAASQAHRGRLVVRTSPAPELHKRFARLERSLDRVAVAVVSAAAIVAGAVLHDGDPRLGMALMIAGAGLFTLSRLFKGNRAL